MATLNELYAYYCKRWDCRPNSAFSHYLDQCYEANDNQRILTEVDVSNNYLGRKGIIPVLDLVKNTKTVKSLDVSNNRLEHEQLAHLCYCLAKHPCITKVSVANNLLHDASIKLIVELLEMNPNITEVIIDGNRFLPSSYALIRSCVEENTQKLQKRAVEDAAIHLIREERRGRVPPNQAEVEDTITPDESGGDLHFSTWYKNPQYCLKVSKDTRVSIVLKVLEDNAAKQSGFVLMRFDGIRRVVEIARKTIVIESPVSSTHTKVEVRLEKEGLYVVMPYTFNPNRSLHFSLTARTIPDAPTLDEGWVTLEKLDAQYDWFTTTIRGEWKGKTAGGDGFSQWWRYNDMYRLQYSGAPLAYNEAAKCTVYVKLFKAIDPEENDEKEIGFYVMEHDPNAMGKGCLPPLKVAQNVTRTSCLHQHSVSVLHKFSCSRSSDLDYFIVPTTKLPHQEGSYTMVIFSTAACSVTASCFPHGWNYRPIAGTWDEANCGGSREWYSSWKNNPAVELEMEAAPPGEERRTAPLMMCLEMKESRGLVGSGGAAAAITSGGEHAVAAMHVDPDTADFLAMHREATLEGMVSVVDAQHPKYSLRRASPLSAIEATLTILDTSPSYYIVPTARHAGQLGTYVLHLFSSQPFVVASTETLASRERSAQLQGYAAENRKRKLTAKQAEASEFENPELMVVREELLMRCLETGLKFSDRDFPRGFSSCWLSPSGPPPPKFPEKYSWVHASEVCSGCMLNGKFTAPYPYGERNWFGSIMNAIAAKPHLLSRLFLHYDPAAGFAQFQFWQGNQWVGVTVDDYLLVDVAGALIYGRSSDPKDALFPLMEKAYAKLHRCYEAMQLDTTPELTLMQVMQQGLTDATSGHTVVYTLNPEPGVPLCVEEREKLWAVLKRCTSTNLLGCLLLRSDDVGVGERKHVGILEDHLYGIMDVRFIEQQRLVKVRNYDEGRDTEWRGKWKPHSPHWTETLLDVLEYKHSKDELWLSFDEVLHYFSNLIIAEESSHTSAVVSNFLVGLDAPDADPQLGFPQFALDFPVIPDDDIPVTVVLELAQPDARCSVTRIPHATARYANSCGIVVIASSDNKRRVKQLKQEEVYCRVRPLRTRDILCTLELHTALIRQYHLSVIPFLEEDGNRSTPVLLRACSSDIQVELQPVRDNIIHTVESQWVQWSCGGSPLRSPAWRDNPQFFLYPSSCSEFTITLHAEEAVQSSGVAVGFTVHETKACYRILDYDEEHVVGKSTIPSPPSGVVTATVKLRGMAERRGMPYIIVPFMEERGVNGDFRVEVIGNCPFNFLPIEPRLDWCCDHRVVSLRTCEGTTGGSPEYPSWRMNPQWAIEFPAGKQGRVVVAVENTKVGDTFNKVGLLLLRADTRWNGWRRRRIAFEEEDVLARAVERFDRTELSVEGTFDTPLILVAYTPIPYREVTLKLSTYTSMPHEIAPVQEWKSVSIEHGSWVLGMTAGGSRTSDASWINNPFLGVTCLRPTQIMAVLIQYPHGPEKPIMKRYKGVKHPLPPPVVNPHLKVSIQLDLLENDDDLTVIESSGPALKHEVVIAAHLEPCENKPYLLVPSTTIPEKNGDFKVLLYADHPVDLFTVEKPRLPYV